MSAPRPRPGPIPDCLRQDDELIRWGLAMLPRREALLIMCHYGVLGERPHTLRELADMHEISPERVRQIVRFGVYRLTRIQAAYWSPPPELP